MGMQNPNRQVSMHLVRPLLSVLVVGFAAAAEPAWMTVTPGLELFVAANGKDTDNGRADRPFATLERARDEIRTLRSTGHLPPGGVTVRVQPGTYELARTLELDQRDAGTRTAPIIWRAQPGTVRLAAR